MTFGPLPEQRSKHCRKRVAGAFAHRNLRHAGNGPLHRVLDADDVRAAAAHVPERGVERGRLSGAGRAGDEHQAVGPRASARSNRAKRLGVVSQTTERLKRAVAVDHPHHQLLAIHRRQSRETDVDRTAAHVEDGTFRPGACGAPSMSTRAMILNRSRTGCETLAGSVRTGSSTPQSGSGRAYPCCRTRRGRRWRRLRPRGRSGGCRGPRPRDPTWCRRPGRGFRRSRPSSAAGWRGRRARAASGSSGRACRVRPTASRRRFASAFRTRTRRRVAAWALNGCDVAYVSVPVVDHERHHEVAPRNPFRDQTDGELTRNGALEVRDLEPTGLRELCVTVLLPDKPERHDGVGEGHLLVTGVLLRQRKVAAVDQGRVGQQPGKAGNADALRGGRLRNMHVRRIGNRARPCVFNRTQPSGAPGAPPS